MNSTFHLSLMKKLELWMDRTKVIINKDMMVVYNLDKVQKNSEIQFITDLNDNMIRLSNKTEWSYPEFIEAIEKKELELVCDCLNLFKEIPVFNLCYLGCPNCEKKNEPCN